MNSGDMSDDTRLVMSASYSWMVVCISVDSSMSDVRVLVCVCVCVVGATLRSRVQASVSRRAWKWSQIWSQDMF